jgi:hypothetical protein
MSSQEAPHGGKVIEKQPARWQKDVRHATAETGEQTKQGTQREATAMQHTKTNANQQDAAAEAESDKHGTKDYRVRDAGGVALVQRSAQHMQVKHGGEQEEAEEHHRGCTQKTGAAQVSVSCIERHAS